MMFPPEKCALAQGKVLILPLYTTFKHFSIKISGFLRKNHHNLYLYPHHLFARPFSPVSIPPHIMGIPIFYEKRYFKI